MPACLLGCLHFLSSSKSDLLAWILPILKIKNKSRPGSQLCSEEIFEFFIERSQEPCKHGDLGSFRAVHVNLKSCFVTMRTPWRIVEQDISILQVTANLLHPLFWPKWLLILSAKPSSYIGNSSPPPPTPLSLSHFLSLFCLFFYFWCIPFLLSGFILSLWIVSLSLSEDVVFLALFLQSKLCIRGEVSFLVSSHFSKFRRGSVQTD